MRTPSHFDHRRRVLLQAGGALALAGLGPAARAQQGLPTGTIRILVGFPPGGGSDIMARYVADKLRERSGANVIVENRSGASTNIAVQAVVNASTPCVRIWPSSGWWRRRATPGSTNCARS